MKEPTKQSSGAVSPPAILLARLVVIFLPLGTVCLLLGQLVFNESDYIRFLQSYILPVNACLAIAAFLYMKKNPTCNDND